jgi:hypothetical protein
MPQDCRFADGASTIEHPASSQRADTIVHGLPPVQRLHTGPVQDPPVQIRTRVDHKYPWRANPAEICLPQDEQPKDERGANDGGVVAEEKPKDKEQYFGLV